MNYRTKSKPVEALRYNGNYEEIVAFIGDTDADIWIKRSQTIVVREHPESMSWYVQPGYWVIKEKGYAHSVSPTTFEDLYEPNA